MRELILFRVRQTTPLLFAAFERFQPADFVRVLKLLSVVSFRYTVVSGLNTNELEPVYHRAAKAVLEGRVSTPADVFAEIRGIYVGDEAFEREFGALDLDTSGQRKRLVKYVLCHLEADASGVARDWETDPGTIEHVLPENPSGSWDEAFSPERQKDFVYRVGNFLLLESSINRNCQNVEFAQKLRLYASSAYGLTKGLAEAGVAEWNPATLGERQSRMADRAVHVWRADFA